jgi:hypothetical protein
MVGKPVIPAQAGILNVRDLRDLDSGSPLRFARNDGGFGLSQCHSSQEPLKSLKMSFLKKVPDTFSL